MGEEDLYGQGSYSQLPPPGPHDIIDLPESHSFIVTEVPPENVMEGDDAPQESTEGKVPEQDSAVMNDDVPPDNAKGNGPPSESKSDRSQENEVDKSVGEPQNEDEGKDAPPEQMDTSV